MWLQIAIPLLNSLSIHKYFLSLAGFGPQGDVAYPHKPYFHQKQHLYATILQLCWGLWTMFKAKKKMFRPLGYISLAARILGKNNVFHCLFPLLALCILNVREDDNNLTGWMTTHWPSNNNKWWHFKPKAAIISSQKNTLQHIFSKLGTLVCTI